MQTKNHFIETKNIRVFPFNKIQINQEFINSSSFYFYKTEVANDFSCTVLVCRIPLEYIDSGWILPHEKSIPGHAESLYLDFKETQTQNNPVLLATDCSDLAKLIEKQSSQASLICAKKTLDGAVHSILKCSATFFPYFFSAPFFTIDGHHRIDAVVKYYRQCRPKIKNPFVMAAICDAHQLIRPHTNLDQIRRVMRFAKKGFFLENKSTYFEPKFLNEFIRYDLRSDDH